MEKNPHNAEAVIEKPSQKPLLVEAAENGIMVNNILVPKEEILEWIKDGSYRIPLMQNDNMTDTTSDDNWFFKKYAENHNKIEGELWGTSFEAQQQNSVSFSVNAYAEKENPDKAAAILILTYGSNDPDISLFLEREQLSRLTARGKIEQILSPGKVDYKRYNLGYPEEAEKLVVSTENADAVSQYVLKEAEAYEKEHYSRGDEETIERFIENMCVLLQKKAGFSDKEIEWPGNLNIVSYEDNEDEVEDRDQAVIEVTESFEGHEFGFTSGGDGYSFEITNKEALAQAVTDFILRKLAEKK